MNNFRQLSRREVPTLFSWVDRLTIIVIFQLVLENVIIYKFKN